MGNFVGAWFGGSAVIALEEGGEAAIEGKVIIGKSDDVSGGAGNDRAGESSNGEGKLKIDVGGAHARPTSVAEVMKYALYATEFHKHLAMTNRSENYDFYQAVSHFTRDTHNKHTAVEEANKIYTLYMSENAPLKLNLEEGISAQIKRTLDEGAMTRQIFDPAHKAALELMEKESLEGFLSSQLYSELKRKIDRGEMEALQREDVDTVHNLMLKEWLEFLGDPDLKKVLSSQTGIDWFRKYLVVEFAEEGLDLWKAVHDMLVQDSAARKGSGNAAAVVAGDSGAPVLESHSEGKAGLKNGEVSHHEFDIRETGRDLQARFINSGCGAECNLSGTVVRKVANALDDDNFNPEAVRKAFEQVEVEIFKLLAYDPFLRFKRSGLYTKYCMEAQVKTSTSAATTSGKQHQRHEDRALSQEPVLPAD